MQPQENIPKVIPEYIQAGIKLANPPPGEEIVISGLAGCFPDSANVYDFQENLFNKVDLVTSDDRRWNVDHPEVPQRTGKILNVTKFDAAFFGIHFKQANAMDPMCRMLMERSYEALIDAGINPLHMKGRRTGVFIGSCFSETEKTWFYDKFEVKGFGITGCSRAMLANRISYWLGINGPSYTLDTACSSSLYAMEHAYKSLRDGHCDSALVGGCNLCLHPNVSLQFSRLGVLSPQGMCKCFDRDANGYARSEAICVVYLQKAREAKRIYATVVHCKTNCDGYKEQGITYPSGEMQRTLLQDFYKECDIKPSSIDYLEAHGTGTKVGDPEELNALDQVFCEGRSEPLPIGSVKSNIGHTEPVSGLCSITKVIIAMETGFIPPNIHYNNPREGVEALKEGRLQVVTEKQRWNGGLVGINSFGFGGANAHVLVKWNEKTKINGGAPNDSLPRLVVASGRTEEAVDVILKDFESRPVDAEFVYLMQDLQSTEIPGHIFRGFTLLNGGNEKIRSIKYYPGFKRPVWFVFSGMGSHWLGMGRSLLKIPIFAAAIDRCQRVLKPHGVDLINVITTNDPRIFDNIINCFVGIAACQIGLVDILKAIGIEADGIIGHSVGELGCGYADGCLTAEQMILTAYYRGLVSAEAKLIRGLMAAVGLGAMDIKKVCPPDIEVACHNGPNFSTLSGPEESMKKFVKALQQNGVFAREVNCCNIAYHSKYIASCGPSFLKYLRNVIPNPKPRSSRWISSSVPESAWDSPLAAHCSAEYQTNNLLCPVLFEEAIQHIPRDAITIEISPHGLLQAILVRSLNKSITNVALTQRGHPDSVELLFTSLGKLYELGLQPQLTNLYPRIEYPVSRSTPMISSLVRWEHSEDWHVTSYRTQEKVKSGERIIMVNLDNEEMEYISGHVVDGRILFPATAYIVLVWETVSLLHGLLYTDVSVVFENVQFHRATNIPKEGAVELLVMVQKGSGKFEIAEGGTAVVSGLVRLVGNMSRETLKLDFPKQENNLHKDDLIENNSRDIYKELRLRGYNYQGLFRSLVSVDAEGKTGKIRWSNNWVAFMDNILQMQILQEDTRGLYVPTAVEKLTIDAEKHCSLIQELKSKTEAEAEPELVVSVYSDLSIIQCGGVEIRGLKASGISRRKPLSEPVLEKHIFVPYEEPEDLDLNSSLRVCVHILLENQQEFHVKTVELYKENITLLSPEIALILGDLPLIQADITVLANPDDPSLEGLKPEGYKIEDNKLSGEQNCLLIVLPDVLNNVNLLQTAKNSLADGAFILAREKLHTEIKLTDNLGLQIVFQRSLDDEKLILLKKVQSTESPTVIHVTLNDYDWLPQVQAAVANNSKQITYLVAQKEPLNGILGLVNCIRKEPGGENVRCVFILDESAPDFDVNLPFYQYQLNKDLAINIYSNGKWGSYRHIKLSGNLNSLVSHGYVNVLQRGDLSTLRWLEGNINPERFHTKPRDELVHVYCCALNFRDIMTATGKLSVEIIARGRMNQECIQGLEYAGRNTKGERVMGMVTAGALSSLIYGDIDLMWKFPDHWSFEDAATVPVVYGTAYYALLIHGRMKKGDTVLIHAGSGGVGQAAITICLYAGCIVYTTVGTEEKREFIKKKFPQLTDHNIGNSRDTSFEQFIMLETGGRGVDLVLNSLAEEKLQASLRCLAVGGRFLEIGKFDLANNNPLGMEVFLKETSFQGIMLDNLFLAPPDWKEDLHAVVEEGLRSGAVQPLTRTVFTEKETEQAFRFMAAGKHIGKVLIKIRPEEDEKVVIPVLKPVEAIPRYFCKEERSYVVIGGLGGFGLELADWLVIRGARKLVLTSRKGLRTGYQSSRVRMWRSYGVKVEISLADVTTESGVKSILTQANSLGPVDAIFNLAVILQDALLENQSESSFKESAGPKPIATHHLDVLSRELCPVLRHFVVFSSVSCGRGNAGQTNYGMNNSIMERICEARVRAGLPGLAVQWGAVGDVGLVADMQEEKTEVVIGGTLQQRITSCLEELDKFMKQPYPVVASMVVAEKRSSGSGANNIVDCISSILGIRDLKTVSFHSTLAELGMDSMMAVEIKQSLERNFEVFLTPQEVRSLTFTRLGELTAAKQEAESSSQEQTGIAADPTEIPDEGLAFLLRVAGDEAHTSQLIMHLPSAIDTQDDVMKTTLFMLPGIECVASVLESLAEKLNCQTVCLQMGYNNMGETLQEMAKSLLPHIQSHLVHGDSFNILGYSFGGLIALEIASLLEEEGFEGVVFLIDSSPSFMKIIYDTYIGTDDVDIMLLCNILRLVAPQHATLEVINKIREEVTPFKGFTERLNRFIQLMPPTHYSLEYQRTMGNAIYARLLALKCYEWSDNKKLKSQIVLIRPSSNLVNIDEDYELSKICDKTVEVNLVPGNHGTILELAEAAAIINEKLSKK